MRLAYFIGGLLFLAIGIAGAFLPILPTTPFLLVAAFCFSRSDKRLESWLMNHRIFGPHLRDWNERKVIRRKAKLLATAMIACSVAFMLSREIPAAAKIAASSVIAAALVFIWSRREA